MLAIKFMHPSNLQAFTENTGTTAWGTFYETFHKMQDNIFENIKYGLLTKLFKHQIILCLHLEDFS